MNEKILKTANISKEDLDDQTVSNTAVQVAGAASPFLPSPLNRALPFLTGTAGSLDSDSSVKPVVTGLGAMGGAQSGSLAGGLLGIFLGSTFRTPRFLQREGADIGSSVGQALGGGAGALSGYEGSRELMGME